MKFSANLGFLFASLPLAERIAAAKKHGFSAVELHWPYDVDPAEVKTALAKTELPVLSLNTVRGDIANGENGLSALSGREAEARTAIEQAVAYAKVIGARDVHVMAGRIADGAQWSVFERNLHFACTIAEDAEIGILIEPLNPMDAPDYLLWQFEEAAKLVKACNSPNLRVMFDIYHAGRLGLDPIATYRQYKDVIGHVQFASLPDRAEPDQGEFDILGILREIVNEGYAGFLGAEYKQKTGSFDWMARCKKINA